MWARIHLIPLLQAEADRDMVRRHWAEQAREKELMGTEKKVYHSDRWVQRHDILPLQTGIIVDNELRSVNTDLFVRHTRSRLRTQQSKK